MECEVFTGATDCGVRIWKKQMWGLFMCYQTAGGRVGTAPSDRRWGLGEWTPGGGLQLTKLEECIYCEQPPDLLATSVS